MGFKTITIAEQAYERLKKRKEPGESFTDVILRELPPIAETCGEVLESFKTHPAPRADRKLRKAMLAGRGRRSKREL